MSQSRARKISGVGGDAGAVRGSVVKASGDSVPCKLLPKEQRQRSRSKNKIPKSIRYDLENALVGLCDVWFEDIKPHLIRNKIKVHVDAAGGCGVGAESGDYQRLPPGAPGCSHLDPGAASDRLRRQRASCAGCCATQPTASRVPCPKPPARFIQPPLPNLLQNNHENVEAKSARRGRRSRRKSRSYQHLFPQSNWRVPRLCRTYSIITPTATPRTITRRAHTAKPPQIVSPCHDNYFQFISPKRRVKTKNKWTQTETLPSRQPRRKPAPVQPPQPAFQFDRCPATTSIIPRRNNYEKINQYTHYPRNLAELSESTGLFHKDLNYDIGDIQDKWLRVLYKSPARTESSSILIAHSQNGQKEIGNVKKPWR